MDRLRAFEVFVAVVARQGFARAAEAVGTSPANVTRYIAELEAHRHAAAEPPLAQALADRQRAGALRAGAQHPRRGGRGQALSASTTLQPRGRLRVNAPVSFGILHLAPLWPKFLQKYPEVELDVSLIDRVVDIVEEGFDLASGFAQRVDRPHRTQAGRLAQYRLRRPGLSGQHGPPHLPADLPDHDCIGYTFSASADEWRCSMPRASTMRSRSSACAPITATRRARPRWRARA